jgi:hypothetical protein
MPLYRFAYKSALVIRDLVASEEDARPHPVCASLLRKLDKALGSEMPDWESIVVDLTDDEIHALQVIGGQRELVVYPPRAQML